MEKFTGRQNGIAGHVEIGDGAMVNDNAGKMIMLDGQTVGIEEANQYEIEGIQIYELVRVMDGKALFLKEHVDRLENSFKVLNKEVPENIKNIRDMIDEFISRAQVLNGNIKIICDRIEGPEKRIMLYESVSSYPERALYEKGVIVATLQKSRTLPGAKIMDFDLRNLVEKIKFEKKAYEIVLVDSEGNITEGSRSNIFFYKDGILHTPPPEKVLPGITRMKVFEFCAKKDIEVKVHPINRKEIANFDGAFLSGTSINILPIKSIDGKPYALTEFAIELSSQFTKNIIEDVLNA